MDRWHSGNYNQPSSLSNRYNPSSLRRRGIDNFTTSHFTRGRVSATRSGTLYNGKRKSSQSESSFHPKTKQLITEARIASSMQRLNLNNSNYSMQNTSNRTFDEGFFEDDFKVNNDSDDDEPDLDAESNKPSILPRFILSPDVKEKLKENENSILPKDIFDAINKPCMAVIPYTPSIVTTTLECHKKTNNELKESHKLTKINKSVLEVQDTSPHYEMIEDEEMAD